MPTSARDPRVVRAARLLRDPLARREEGAFVVDHPELLAAAVAAGLRVDVVFVAEGAAGSSPASGGAPVLEAAPDALRALSAVGQSPEVLAVVRTPAPPPPGLPPGSLVLAQVAGAGNVGSIVRTAAAFGLPRVALTPGCADPWSRPALRAALGASLRPGLVATGQRLRTLAALDDRPPLAAALARDGVPPADLPPGAAVVLGSEGEGLDAEERRLCDLAVTIPAPGFESLNVAAAAAVLAFALQSRVTTVTD